MQIAFNWDIIYEVAYRNLNSFDLDLKQLGLSDKVVNSKSLFKLHGSSNWGICEICGFYVARDKIVQEILRIDMLCPKCNQKNLSGRFVFFSDL